MATYLWPSSAELKEVEQIFIPKLTMDDPILGAKGIFPMRNSDSDLLIWEQREDYLGLQAVRGLDGAPPRVLQTPYNQFIQKPGYFGEQIVIAERELTTRRKIASWDAPIDLSEPVREAQDKLLVRQISRIRAICWGLLTTGHYEAYDDKNSLLYRESYSRRVFPSSVPWSTYATATPLADLRAVQLGARGYSTTFGSGSIAYMNQGTLNNLLSNSNSADLYGRRSTGLATLNTMSLVNELFAGDGLPMIMVYDEGYKTDGNVFVNFIPDNTVIVVGKRSTGTPLGEFRMTRNANNPNMEAGSYVKVIDRGESMVPRTIEVHRGFNGGPALFLGSSIIVMTV